jgi:hypothetical protein
LASQISSLIRNDMNQIKISSYSDILSSTASSLKTRETPILIRQDVLYEPELGGNDICDKTKSTHTTFKTNSKNVTSSGGNLNAAFNQHEPLSANSETNFSHSDKLLIYDDPKSLINQQQPGSNIVFRNHLDNCNSSLVKLVTISQQISNLAESNKIFSNLNISHTGTATPTDNHTYNTVLNDSSLVSESVDNFNGHEDYYDECHFTNTSRDEVNNEAVIDSVAELYANHRKLSSSKPPLGFRDTKRNSPINNNNNNNCTINTTFNLDATTTSTSTPSSSSNYNNLETSITNTTKNDSLNSNYFNNTNTTNTNTYSSKNSNEGLITKFSIINVDKNEASATNMKTFSHGNNSIWASLKSESTSSSSMPLSRINLIKQKLGVEKNFS